MKTIDHTYLLRIPMAIILLLHSVPGIFNNGINDFGNLYLNQIGLAPFGLTVAWAIKISHIVAAMCLLFKRYVKIAAVLTIYILIMGIALIHFEEGWYVVGSGRNGIEFNFLLIFVLLFLIFPNGFKLKAVLKPES